MRNLHLESVLSAEAISGKAVIYMWHAEEDGNHYHYILLAIVHSVIGGPSRSSRLSQLKVQKILSTQFTRMAGRTSKFVVTIDKLDCLAFNLQLQLIITLPGKLDSRH